MLRQHAVLKPVLLELEMMSILVLLVKPARNRHSTTDGARDS